MSLPSTLQSLVIEAPAEPRNIFAGVDHQSIAYLRADDRAAMESAFSEVAGQPVTLQPGTTFYYPGIGDVSVIGVILNDDAVLDGDGNIVTPPTAKPGWHVNVLPS